MLVSGKKFRALRDKKKYSNSRVVRKKISERNKKPFPLPQVKWSVPYVDNCDPFFFFFYFLRSLYCLSFFDYPFGIFKFLLLQNM